MQHTKRAQLQPHPATPTSHVHAVSVTARRSGNALSLHYALQGEFSRLRIPAARAPRAADELWRRTCFEAFVAAMGDVAYREFNFSPSGEWAVYAFRSYRDRDADAAAAEPVTAVRASEHALALEAQVQLPGVCANQVLQIGLTAVVEDDAGALSYWALRHAAGKPDFHNRHTFALEIPAP